jgi:plastocyanin
MRTRINLILLTVLLLTACGTKTISPVGNAGPVLSGSAAVKISGYAFDPASTTVKVGTTVTWTNQDSATHNVLADDKSFASNDLRKGDTFKFTFSKPGTYPYRCGFHANMKATIIVVQ